jgi:hypothetical protein
MKKTSTVRVNGNMIFKGHKLTIGLDLGDRWSNYCVLDEAGEVLMEQKLATTPEAMKQTFEKIPRSLLALETGTHSPWLSRLCPRVALCAGSDRSTSYNARRRRHRRSDTAPIVSVWTGALPNNWICSTGSTPDKSCEHNRSTQPSNQLIRQCFPQ